MRNIPKYSSHAFLFPKHDIDPKEKDAEWCRLWAEAIYSSYLKDRSGLQFSRRDDYAELRSYAKGQQSPEKYMKRLVGGSKPGEHSRKGFMNIDKEIFSPAPKFVNIILGIFDNMDHKAYVSAIDELGGTEKKQMKFDLYYQKQSKKWLEGINNAAGLPSDTPERLPASMEELDLYDKMGGFKSKMELAFEKALDGMWHFSEWPETKRKVFEDFITYNFGMVKDSFNPVSQRVEADYVNVTEAVIHYNRKDNFDKSSYAGEFRDYTIAELRVLTKLNEEELLAIANQYTGYQGNSKVGYGDTTNHYETNSNGFPYDDVKINVLDCEWFSVDDYYKLHRKNKEGRTMTYDVRYGETYNTENRRTTITHVKTVYKCKWLVGTPYTFDTGMQHDIPRPDMSEPRLSFHAYKLPGKSIIETIKPILDQIQMAWLKFQNALAKARPHGIAVEWNSLQNMDIGQGKMNPLEILKITRETGDLVYKATTHRGQINTHAAKPITELKGGVGPLLDEFIKILEYSFSVISGLTGIDHITSATSAPSPDTAVGTSKLALNATNNALKMHYSGYLWLKQRLAENACARIQVVAGYSKEGYKSYAPAIGPTAAEVIKIGRDATLRQLGIKIMLLPTAERRDSILTAATQALKPGKDGNMGITYPDFLMIEDSIEQGNLKHAEALLNFKMAKRAEASRAEKENAIQLQNQGLLEIKKEDGLQAEAKTKRETEAQIEIDNNKAELEEGNAEKQHVREMELKGADMKIAQLKINSSNEKSEKVGEK